jgi:hypothetical protein
MTFDDAIAIVRLEIAGLMSRKRQMELEMNPLPDIAWQYASGCVNGARQVLATLIKVSRETNQQKE